MSQTFDKFQSGEMTIEQALHELALDLGEVESELELHTQKLQAERSSLRDQIAMILAVSQRDKAVVPGFGTMIMTKPSYRTKWDNSKLSKLMNRLRVQGYHEIADQILSCSEESEIAGSLRITREKK